MRPKLARSLESRKVRKELLMKTRERESQEEEGEGVRRCKKGQKKRKQTIT